MARELHRKFADTLWIQQEDNIVTIGIHEDTLEDFEEIVSFDLPKETESVDPDSVIGSIETDDGTLDLYSPVSGTVVEINSTVIEDPSLIQEDPFDSWILKIETDENIDSLGEDEDEDEDEEDEDLDEDEDEESEEEEEE